jgi:hypothetical protein
MASVWRAMKAFQSDAQYRAQLFYAGHQRWFLSHQIRRRELKRQFTLRLRDLPQSAAGSGASASDLHEPAWPAPQLRPPAQRRSLPTWASINHKRPVDGPTPFWMCSSPLRVGIPAQRRAGRPSGAAVFVIAFTTAKPQVIPWAVGTVGQPAGQGDGIHMEKHGPIGTRGGSGPSHKLL